MEQRGDWTGKIIRRDTALLQREKDGIIRQKVQEKTGLDIDINEEAERKFSRFVVEHRGSKETVWFNDGSPEGLRVVTFENHTPEFSSCDFVNKGKMNLNISFTYY